jgi:hypothetical protein
VCDWARLSVDVIAGCVDFRERQDSLHANGIHRGLLGLTGSGVLLLLTLGVWYFGHERSDTKSIEAAGVLVGFALLILALAMPWIVRIQTLVLAGARIIRWLQLGGQSVESGSTKHLRSGAKSG